MIQEKLQVLTIGSATCDIFINCHPAINSMSDREKQFIMLEEGVKIEVTSVTESCGGGAINAALVLSAMGYKTTAFFSRANDCVGNRIEQEIQTKGIDSSSSLRTDKTTTAVSFIIEAPSGNNPILNFRGANEFLSFENIAMLFQKKTYHGVYIAPLSGPCGNDLKRITDQKTTGQLFLHNPSMHQLENYTNALIKALPHIDVLLVNKTEAEKLFSLLAQKNCNHPSGHQKEGALFSHFGPKNCTISCFFNALHALGCPLVVVTNGKEGAYASSADASSNAVYFVPSKKITLANTVGAGDTFGATLLASLLQKKALLDSLQRATHQSAHLLGQKTRPGYFLPLENLAEIAHNRI